MQYDYIWNNILSSLEKNIAENEFKWVKPLSIYKMEGNLITILCPNKFVKSWVEDKYLNLIKEAFHNDFAINNPVIEFIINNNISKSESVKDSSNSNNTYFNQLKEVTDRYSVPFNKSFTFDSFVPGTSNKYAYAVCSELSKNFEMIYNPLYIYGDVGLGKTHLLHAIGNRMRIDFPKLKIINTTGDLYLNEFIAALQNKKLDEFKEKYTSADILLFDDVQMITKGEKTTEEFLVLFNFMHDNNKQIVLTSNNAPSDINSIDKRLSTRFSSGIMAEIKYPSTEEKIAILLKHIELLKGSLKFNINISTDMIKYIVENTKTDSTRELIGILKAVITKAELLDIGEINIEYLQEEFKDFLISKDKNLSPEEIINIVSSYYNLRPADLKTTKRSNNIVIPRNIAMYFLQQKTLLTVSAIGEFFNRDHSTVIHAINKIKKMAEDDNIIKNSIEMLDKQMKMNS